MQIKWTPPDEPAEYFPPSNGLYEVTAGLRKFGTDFGNGVQDQRIFQLDTRYADFVANKMECRAEDLDKYYARIPSAREDAFKAICIYIMRQLEKEYPAAFRFRDTANGFEFHMLAFEQSLELDAACNIVQVRGSAPQIPYWDLFDALSCCVQDDIAIMEKTPDGGNILTRAHICAAGHWAPQEKIGKDFVFIHKPVPGSDAMNRSSRGLIEGVIQKGPYVRFTWGIVTDLRLNHHPDPPPGLTKEEWDGRKFDPNRPDFHLRVERQTLVGFPEQQAFLFCIRPQYMPGDKIRSSANLNQALISALSSMSPESRVYKGLGSTLEPLVKHLQEARSPVSL